MLLNSWKATALLVVCTLLGACDALPHRDIRQPRAMFTVRDSAGRAIPSTTLFVYSAIGEAVGAVAAVTVTAEGLGRLSRITEWTRAKRGVPDEVTWTWGWCAIAPGYARASGRFALEPKDTIHVVLARGESTRLCPSDPRSLYQAAPR